jgi:predicted nucleotide-binding protein
MQGTQKAAPLILGVLGGYAAENRGVTTKDYTKMTAPTVFIGSSSEARDIAYAIQSNLDRDTEPTVWDQGVFELSRSTLDNLAQALHKFDFGIFVLSADDVLRLRSKRYATARDNVLFELGLFIGQLGSERTFFIVPQTDTPFRLPTDLAGITYATYSANRSDNNFLAALGPACNQILSTIRKHGSRVLPVDNTTESVAITRSREEHYEVAIDMIRAAKRRLFVIERTPVLLFGPRHFWYEKEYYSALKAFAESTQIYNDRICRCMYIARDSRQELAEVDNRDSVIENLRECKELEKQSEGRFQFSSLDAYYGSFMVADESCSIWFKGSTNAISICRTDAPAMATTLVEIFNRLVNGMPKGLDRLLAELES